MIRGVLIWLFFLEASREVLYLDFSDSTCGVVFCGAFTVGCSHGSIR